MVTSATFRSGIKAHLRVRVSLGPKQARLLLPRRPEQHDPQLTELRGESRGSPALPRRRRPLGRRYCEGMPSKRQLTVAAGYVAAGAVYIAIGVWFTDFLLSFWVALAYLLVVVWLVPTGLRRIF